MATQEKNFQRLEPESSISSPITEEDSNSLAIQKLQHLKVRVKNSGIAPTVFWPALILVGASALFAMLFPEPSEKVLAGGQSWIVENLGWFYALAITFFLGFSIFLAFSKYGRIKLGRDTDKPDFGRLTWFSMLFAAGMGIGLVFYGVGEPVTFAFVDPKPGTNADESAMPGLAMAQTFVHWGFHPWSIYAVVGLAIGLAVHRRGRPVSPRWAFEPLLGSKVTGWQGDVVDVLTIAGTMFGVATSLGLGVRQISQGLIEIGVVEQADLTLMIALIVVITLITTYSVISGVNKGMKYLSNITMSMAAVLTISVAILGPTVFLAKTLVQSLGLYLSDLMSISLDTGAFTGDEGNLWATSWTMFYWGWWISWGPFVGMFIARISRGRTIREFIAGVLLVPTLTCVIWFSVLGGAGIHQQLFGDQPLVEANGDFSVEKGLFSVLAELPFGLILSVLTILLIIIFFITSADSGSLVVTMLASGGLQNPPKWMRGLYTALIGMLSIGLLIAGGLGTLRAASLIMALPFCVMILFMCWSIMRSLRNEPIIKASETAPMQVAEKSSSE